MTGNVATLKLGAILASIVVSSYAFFGHDAWAPEPARLTQPLSGSNGASAAAYYDNTLGFTTVVKWPTSWTPGPPEAGSPCSTVNLPYGYVTTSVIERTAGYARCTQWTWITPGARLTSALSGIGSIAPATDLATGEETTVVQFPQTWTYDTTLAAETYCTTFPGSAGNVVGMIIVRWGNYAKCSS
jgi:hypothetical protein